MVRLQPADLPKSQFLNQQPGLSQNLVCDPVCCHSKLGLSKELEPTLLSGLLISKISGMRIGQLNHCVQQNGIVVRKTGFTLLVESQAPLFDSVALVILAVFLFGILPLPPFLISTASGE